MSRVILACTLTAAIMAAGAPASTAAQAYPSRPVRYLVPFPAGGSPDIVARLVPQQPVPMCVPEFTRLAREAGMLSN